MLTVLITTFNGADTLPTVLDAYCKLTPPQGGWKLVVVDNGSTDSTREITKSFSRHLPLESIFEASRGQNAARNAGLARIDGDLIVFSDDDVVPKPDWLWRLREVADHRVDFSIFGGRIVARWEVSPEPWILNWVHQGVTYSLTPPGMQAGPAPFSHIFSGNMAIRAEVFAAGYRFDPALGPKAGSYAMGSETGLLLRLMQDGYKAWHCPDSVVEHMIQQSQMTKPWVLSKATRFGRGQLRIELMNAGWAPGLGEITRSTARGIAGRLVRLAMAHLQGNAEACFRETWRLHFLIGRVIEWRRCRRERVSSNGKQSNALLRQTPK
jgi:glycosyltransferase involved in cell wall biosynthesis